MQSPSTWRRSSKRGLRLWPVGIVLALAFAAALLVAAGVFLTAWDLLGARGLKTEQQIDSKTLFDLVKLSFGVVAGAGALVALIVAYRRQRVDEDGALRDVTRLHTERFTTAVSQLGDESAAVRLGGVHALAGLADDAPSPELRQTCIDVLCAYLRLPYTSENELPAGDTAARHTFLAHREVRHTVIRIIRDHLRPGADQQRSWMGYHLDFTGAVFDGGDFSGSVFTTGGTVDFSNAVFLSGKVDFSDAHFQGGEVTFHKAHFSGSKVDFSSAWFSLSRVDFRGANFEHGTISFGQTRLEECSLDFTNAGFAGSRVSFSRALLVGGFIIFQRAAFSASTVSFIRTGFAGSNVDFRDSEFHGGMTLFHHADFSGGVVDFTYAAFFGGTVSFSDARGAVQPLGLVPADGTLPDGLEVPASWRPSTA
ncbi:pentapeptide repeat-containing protein [Streptomyces sp. YC504]|uniref:Pentapeptide repeat-containing protein n=1 Tax=Streptomyces mesophilus TaxID=1775132 RepID=A0A6G4XLP3_9ACTN|nr:pentapeptide repeat-containing protein [Streptomyces mesophilus]NGO77747.1 pentapeptide repeat-containing protein [Streptomyces mesophilus]